MLEDISRNVVDEDRDKRESSEEIKMVSRPFVGVIVPSS
jgi:hypothetical protein